MRKIDTKARQQNGGYFSTFKRFVCSLVIVTVLFPSGTAAGEPNLTLPGLDGLGLDLHLAVSATPVTGSGATGNLHVTLDQRTVGLALGLPAETGRLTNALPGLDGLGTTSLALDNALNGAAGAALRALLEQSDPELLRNVNGNLAVPLPGLEAAAPAPLPGIDGLPITLPDRRTVAPRP